MSAFGGETSIAITFASDVSQARRTRDEFIAESERRPIRLNFTGAAGPTGASAAGGYVPPPGGTSAPNPFTTATTSAGTASAAFVSGGAFTAQGNNFANAAGAAGAYPAPIQAAREMLGAPQFAAAGGAIDGGGGFLPVGGMVGGIAAAGPAAVGRRTGGGLFASRGTSASGQYHVGRTRALVSAFGLLEAVHAQRALSQADFAAALADSPADVLRARAHGIDATQGGFFGGFASLLSDSVLGPAGPTGRREQLLAQAARSDSLNRMQTTIADTTAARAGIAGFGGGGLTGMSRATIAASGAREVAGINQRIGELNQANALMGPQVSTAAYGLIQQRRSEVASLQQRARTAADETTQKLEIFDRQTAVRRETLSAEAGTFRDQTLGIFSKGQLELRQQRRQDILERRQQQLEDPAGLEGLQRMQDARRGATERDIRLREAASDITLAGRSRSAFLRAAGNPAAAAANDIVTETRAQLTQADWREVPGVLALGAGRLSELGAENFRSGMATQRGLGVQQRQVERMIARDPLGAEIEGIRGQTTEALFGVRGMPSMFGMKAAVEAGIRGVGAAREQFARQQDADRWSVAGETLGIRNSQLRALTNETMSPEARAMAGAARGIAGEALQGAAATLRAGGTTALAQQSIIAGALGLKGLQQDWIQSFQPTTVEAPGRFAIQGHPSLEDAAGGGKTLEEIKAILASLAGGASLSDIQAAIKNIGQAQ